MLITLIVVEPPVSNNSAVSSQLLTRKQASWGWKYPTTSRAPKGKKLDPSLLMRDIISVRITR